MISMNESYAETAVGPASAPNISGKPRSLGGSKNLHQKNSPFRRPIHMHRVSRQTV